jgi:hypothetical protein
MIHPCLQEYNLTIFTQPDDKVFPLFSWFKKSPLQIQCKTYRQMFRKSLYIEKTHVPGKQYIIYIQPANTNNEKVQIFFIYCT